MADDAPRPQITQTKLRDRFFYHPTTDAGAKRHAELSESFFDLARRIVLVCPPGHELALALTKLEEAKMHASSAVARNPETR